MKATMAHECNAYCRDGVHTQLAYLALLQAHWEGLVDPLAQALAEQVCEEQGVEFVSLEPAPEAPPEIPAGYVGFTPGRGTHVPEYHKIVSRTPYLLRFRYGVPR